MNPALWLLIRLQFGGLVRYLARNVRTVKGALLALVGLLVIFTWLASLILSSAVPTSTSCARENSPALAKWRCMSTTT